MTKVQYVTFCTPRYAHYLAHLQKTAAEFGLTVYAEEVPEFETWGHACGYKPFFILSMMQRFHGLCDALVWVDVDAEFRGRPDLFEDGEIPEEFYWAVYHTNESQRKSGMHRFGAGTMWFRTTDFWSSSRLLAEWCSLQLTRGPGNDQITLEIAAPEDAPKKKPFPLPRAYREKHTKDDPPDGTVINHLMASRKYKNQPCR